MNNSNSATILTSKRLWSCPPCTSLSTRGFQTMTRGKCAGERLKGRCSSLKSSHLRWGTNGVHFCAKNITGLQQYVNLLKHAAQFFLLLPYWLPLLPLAREGELNEGLQSWKSKSQRGALWPKHGRILFWLTPQFTGDTFPFLDFSFSNLARFKFVWSTSFEVLAGSAAVLFLLPQFSRFYSNLPSINKNRAHKLQFSTPKNILEFKTWLSHVKSLSVLPTY